MKKMSLAFVCALAVAAAPASALAASSPRATPKVAAVDVTYIQSGIQDNMALVSAADLAEQHTTNVVALRLAHLILNSHSRYLANLESLAHRLGIAIPTSTTAEQQSMLAALQKLTGRPFVAQFAADEVTGHQEFIALAQQEIATGANPAARASARFFLPIMQHRLSMAQGTVKAIAAL